MANRIRLLTNVTFIILCSIILSGCGTSPRSDSVFPDNNQETVLISELFSETDDEKDAIFYEVKEEEIIYDLVKPDDEWFLKDKRKYCYIKSGQDSTFCDGLYFVRRTGKQIGNKLFIIDDICDEEVFQFYQYENHEWPMEKTTSPYRMYYGSYISVFEDDQYYKSYAVNMSEWGEENYIIVKDIIGLDEQENLYLELWSMKDPYEIYIGIYRPEESCNILGKLPIDSTMVGGKDICFDMDKLLYYNSDKKGDFASPSKTIYSLNLDNMDEGVPFTYNFFIKGYCYKTGESSLFYGIDEDRKFYICNISETDPIYKGELSGEKNYTIDAESIWLYADISEDENAIFVTDGIALWTIYDEKTSQSFLLDNNIVLDEIVGISTEDDGFKIVAVYKGKYILYHAKLVKGHQGEKKTIRFAVAYKHPVMEEFISVYNRRNPNYKVITETVDLSVSMEDYAQNIAVEIATGKGPELIDDMILSPLTPCRNGTFECLDDLVEKTDNTCIIPAILECGKVDGHQYGIPWMTSFCYCSVPKSIMNDEAEWTLSGCINNIEKSGYTKFGRSGTIMMDPERIVMFLGLYDMDNDLIDWKEGKSHLEGEDFIRLLEFSKTYGSDENYLNYMNNDDDYYKMMEAACQCEFLLGFETYESYQVMCHDEDANLVGYPGSQGGKVYVSSASIYVNAGSENIEGAKDFLAYFISKEGQEEYTRISQKKSYQNLSISSYTIDEYIKDFNEKLEGIERYRIGRNGKIKIEPFTEKEILAYKKMVYNSCPIRKELDPIEEIVEEELTAFLEDQKTAEETAKVIDSRVQIYLDEIKH